MCRLGGRLGVARGEAWSCYEGGELPCGRCAACLEWREAFRDAGVTDLTNYTDPDDAFLALDGHGG